VKGSIDTLIGDRGQCQYVVRPYLMIKTKLIFATGGKCGSVNGQVVTDKL
jgi:hypothetical protein